MNLLLANYECLICGPTKTKAQHHVERRLWNMTDPSLSPAPKLCAISLRYQLQKHGRGRLFRFSRNHVRTQASCFLAAPLRSALIWMCPTYDA